MNWKNTEKRALSGRFVSEKINTFIINNTIDRLEYEDFQVHLTSFIIMGIEKLIVSHCNSLNLLGVGELTLLRLSSLTPVSEKAGFCASRVLFRKLG